MANNHQAVQLVQSSEMMESLQQAVQARLQPYQLDVPIASPFARAEGFDTPGPTTQGAYRTMQMQGGTPLSAPPKHVGIHFNGTRLAPAEVHSIAMQKVAQRLAAQEAANTPRYNTPQYNTQQYNTPQYDTPQYNTPRGSISQQGTRPASMFAARPRGRQALDLNSPPPGPPTHISHRPAHASPQQWESTVGHVAASFAPGQLDGESSFVCEDAGPCDVQSSPAVAHARMEFQNAFENVLQAANGGRQPLVVRAVGEGAPGAASVPRHHLQRLVQASDLYHDCMCRELAQWSRRARELGTETRALRLELEASTLQVQQLDKQLQSQHSLAADHQAAEALLKQELEAADRATSNILQQLVTQTKEMEAVKADLLMHEAVHTLEVTEKTELVERMHVAEAQTVLLEAAASQLSEVDQVERLKLAHTQKQQLEDVEVSMCQAKEDFQLQIEKCKEQCSQQIEAAAHATQAEVERRCEMERAMMHKEELLERTLCQLAEAREATNQNHVASKEEERKLRDQVSDMSTRLLAAEEAIAAHQERSALLETAKVQLETDTTQAQAESSKARGELEAMQAEMEQLVELEREMHQEKVELLQELSKTEASFVAAERNSSAEAESARLALESASQLAEEQGARLEATESALAASRHELQVATAAAFEQTCELELLREASQKEISHVTCQLQEEARVCESAALTLMEERSASKLNQEKLDLMQQQLDQMNQLTEDNQAMLHQREQELLEQLKKSQMLVLALDDAKSEVEQTLEAERSAAQLACRQLEEARSQAATSLEALEGERSNRKSVDHRLAEAQRQLDCERQLAQTAQVELRLRETTLAADLKKSKLTVMALHEANVKMESCLSQQQSTAESVLEEQRCAHAQLAAAETRVLNMQSVLELREKELEALRDWKEEATTALSKAEVERKNAAAEAALALAEATANAAADNGRVHPRIGSAGNGSSLQQDVENRTDEQSHNATRALLEDAQRQLAQRELQLAEEQQKVRASNTALEETRSFASRLMAQQTSASNSHHASLHQSEALHLVQHSHLQAELAVAHERLLMERAEKTSLLSLMKMNKSEAQEFQLCSQMKESTKQLQETIAASVDELQIARTDCQRHAEEVVASRQLMQTTLEMATISQHTSDAEKRTAQMDAVQARLAHATYELQDTRRLLKAAKHLLSLKDAELKNCRNELEASERELLQMPHHLSASAQPVDLLLRNTEEKTEASAPEIIKEACSASSTIEPANRSQELQKALVATRGLVQQIKREKDELQQHMASMECMFTQEKQYFESELSKQKCTISHLGYEVLRTPEGTGLASLPDTKSGIEDYHLERVKLQEIDNTSSWENPLFNIDSKNEDLSDIAFMACASLSSSAPAYGQVDTNIARLELELVREREQRRAAEQEALALQAQLSFATVRLIEEERARGVIERHMVDLQTQLSKVKMQNKSLECDMPPSLPWSASMSSP